MKAVQFEAFGDAHQVADAVEVADPGPPDAGEVLVDVEAFPINPVDLLTIATLGTAARVEDSVPPERAAGCSSPTATAAATRARSAARGALQQGARNAARGL